MAMHLEPLSTGPSELFEPTFLTGLPDVLSSWRIAAVLIQGFGSTSVCVWITCGSCQTANPSSSSAVQPWFCISNVLPGEQYSGRGPAHRGSKGRSPLSYLFWGIKVLGLCLSVANKISSACQNSRHHLSNSLRYGTLLMSFSMLKLGIGVLFGRAWKPS